MSLPTTRFIRLIGCRLPIRLARMPPTSVPDLVAAVTNAGGLGMPGGACYAPEQLAADLEGLARSADGPCGVTFLAPFLEPELLEIAAARARVVELVWGAPDPSIIHRIHAGGRWRASRLARWPKPARPRAPGVMLSSFQGIEAGGHVRATRRRMRSSAERARTWRSR